MDGWTLGLMLRIAVVPKHCGGSTKGMMWWMFCFAVEISNRFCEGYRMPRDPRGGWGLGQGGKRRGGTARDGCGCASSMYGIDRPRRLWHVGRTAAAAAAGRDQRWGSTGSCGLRFVFSWPLAGSGGTDTGHGDGEMVEMLCHAVSYGHFVVAHAPCSRSYRAWICAWRGHIRSGPHAPVVMGSWDGGYERRRGLGNGTH
jgi:hypothetical protein